MVVRQAYSLPLRENGLYLIDHDARPAHMHPSTRYAAPRRPSATAKDGGEQGMGLFYGKKSIVPPSTFTKIHFSSLNFKIGQNISLNFCYKRF